MKWNILSERQFKQAVLDQRAAEREFQRKYERKAELYRYLALDNDKKLKQIKTLEGDMIRMEKEKKEVI